jgi:hypothetical protein
MIFILLLIFIIRENDHEEEENSKRRFLHTMRKISSLFYSQKKRFLAREGTKNSFKKNNVV